MKTTTFLAATGAYLPEKVLSNRELAPRVGVNEEWLFNVSGIRERRIASDEETVDWMALEASHRCLKQAHHRHAHLEVGAVVVACGSYPQRSPGPAARLAAELGLRNCPAFDVPVASAGSIIGLNLAHVLTTVYGNVLLVASEKMSAFGLREPLERSVAPLFGDGAAACLLRRDAGFAKLEASVLHSDGKHWRDIRINDEGRFLMRGRAVIQQASKRIPESIREVLDRTTTTISDVVAFIVHQANLHVILRAADALGVAHERFFCNIEKYGNTSSASMLIALHEWCAEHKWRAGDPVVLSAFGAGYHWGAALLIGC
ncbi:MAG TPA: ketoacyl-ACP synthase III [candidate division Zixibacteria bacterium]|nr:ketoacyl-ACP synthase III [candidate division Zixibacteria bacterium]